MTNQNLSSKKFQKKFRTDKKDLSRGGEKAQRYEMQIAIHRFDNYGRQVLLPFRVQKTKNDGADFMYDLGNAADELLCTRLLPLAYRKLGLDSKADYCKHDLIFNVLIYDTLNKIPLYDKDGNRMIDHEGKEMSKYSHAGAVVFRYPEAGTCISPCQKYIINHRTGEKIRDRKKDEFMNCERGLQIHSVQAQAGKQPRLPNYVYGQAQTPVQQAAPVQAQAPVQASPVQPIDLLYKMAKQDWSTVLLHICQHLGEEKAQYLENNLGVKTLEQGEKTDTIVLFPIGKIGNKKDIEVFLNNLFEQKNINCLIKIL